MTPPSGTRRRLRHAGKLQRQRIGDGDMAAGARQQNRVVGCRAVEVLPGRMAAGVELDLVVAAGAYPAALRRRRGAFGEFVDQHGKRRCRHGRRIDPSHGDPGRDEMQVIIDETGAGEATFEIDDLRGWPFQAQHVGTAAGGENLALPYGKGFADALFPAAPDATVVQDQVSFECDGH